MFSAQGSLIALYPSCDLLTVTYTIIRSKAQLQYYDESLAEGLHPLRMMQIPAGTFVMGSPDEEGDRTDAEGPQHEVSLSQFFIAQYPVTQAQWRAVAAIRQVNQRLKFNPSEFKGDLNPVEQVSWYDAVEFCDRITIHTNRPYRLPTEAEWEYACRAGTTTPFNCGQTITTDLANYRGTDDDLGHSGSYGDGPKGEYRQKTTPVDYFGGVNTFGLADMHGNVWEWCQDHWHDNYEGAPTDGSAWLTDNEKANRILRGGSWLNHPSLCRSAYCYSHTFPAYRYSRIGFRVVCSALRSQP